MRLKSIWMACIFFFLTFPILGQSNESIVTPKKTRDALPELHSAVAATSNPTQSYDSAPKIVVPDQRYNFGSVVEDEKVVHEFTIVNKGNAPLNIQKVKTG